MKIFESERAFAVLVSRIGDSNIGQYRTHYVPLPFQLRRVCPSVTDTRSLMIAT